MKKLFLILTVMVLYNCVNGQVLVGLNIETVIARCKANGYTVSTNYDETCVTCKGKTKTIKLNMVTALVENGGYSNYENFCTSQVNILPLYMKPGLIKTYNQQYVSKENPIIGTIWTDHKRKLHYNMGKGTPGKTFEVYIYRYYAKDPYAPWIGNSARDVKTYK